MSSDVSEKENESSNGLLKQTIDSATALATVVPIYQDAVQPIAKETGKALGTIGKAVNVALAPISLVVWGYDQISDFLENKVTQKLENVPEEQILTPPPHVAGPAIEALKFTGHDETLRDMFANLIANSLDSKTAIEAHPAFVDIIRNISPDEGLILKLFTSHQDFPIVDVKIVNEETRGFNILERNVSLIGEYSNCTHPDLTANYLDNLCRLGVLNIPPGRHLSDDKAYEEIANKESILTLKKQHEKFDKHIIDFDKKYIEVTGIGRQFINACVVDKRIRT
ncbi:DUF4393 domain-containing protein [Vibrio scophthalmi]|uniref:DUF4393 domain-containing protein n=1 Tax=Vibrio scophthalmi TaxID=45658 RepID=UPI002283E2C4|nr:DUF4393 domain-containing protein [Vibrio scophthalmi]MCY9803344.1 DUF4393 domain-containing protein [Vibrio scophthalmi]